MCLSAIGRQKPANGTACTSQRVAGPKAAGTPDGYTVPPPMTIQEVLTPGPITTSFIGAILGSDRRSIPREMRHLSQWA